MPDRGTRSTRAAVAIAAVMPALAALLLLATSQPAGAWTLSLVDSVTVSAAVVRVADLARGSIPPAAAAVGWHHPPARRLRPTGKSGPFRRPTAGRRWRILRAWDSRAMAASAAVRQPRASQLRAESGRAVAVEAEESDDTATLTGVRGEEFQHSLIGAPGFTSEGP